jgi:valyl-tRNA synthetase
MQSIIELITTLRNLRAQWNIKPQEKIQCHLSSQSKTDLSLLQNSETLLKNLARIDELTIDKKPIEKKNAATVIIGSIKGAVPLGDLIDVKQEKKRMLDHIAGQKKVSTGLTSRLSNKDFLAKAPKEVVAKEKVRLDSINTKIKELEKVVSGLEL